MGNQIGDLFPAQAKSLLARGAYLRNQQFGDLIKGPTICSLQGIPAPPSAFVLMHRRIIESFSTRFIIT